MCLDEKTTQCKLCPRFCELREGQVGFCYVRRCVDGEIILDNYGGLTHIAIEPIEKKPITYFLRGTKTLSIGSWGCNLSCKFCENFKYSQSYNKKEIKYFTPEKVIEIAKEKHCQSVCMTYNEPTLYYEYLLDIANKCHESGLKFILKTNAYINKEPWREICNVTDAMNIDCKGSSVQYKEITGANAYVIRERIEEANRAGVHIEISIPLYHGFLDDVRVFYECSCFLGSVNRGMPCHLLKVFPANKHEEFKSTSDLILSTAKHILSFHMDNVDISD